MSKPVPNGAKRGGAKPLVKLAHQPFLDVVTNQPKVAIGDVISNDARLQELKGIIESIKAHFARPGIKPSKAAKTFLKDAIRQYELVSKASIGVPTYSENATLQFEAPNDIPTAPLSGLNPVQRTAYIVKLANSGSTAGGFYATLQPQDFAPWVSADTGAKYFRVRKITSWTVPRADGGVQQGTFAGVSSPAQLGTSGTEALPTWAENWEPVGQGYAGIVTQYPLGAYPLYSVVGDGSAIIVFHYTSLGGVGGVTNIPVVFHALIETLI